MIKKIEKYYSDIDSDIEFYKEKDAEEFETIFKELYDIRNECYKRDEDIVDEKEVSGTNEEFAKQIFDKTKMELNKWVKTKYQSKILPNFIKKLKYNQDDIDEMVLKFDTSDEYYKPKHPNDVIGLIFWYIDYFKNFDEINSDDDED